LIALLALTQNSADQRILALNTAIAGHAPQDYPDAYQTKALKNDLPPSMKIASRQQRDG
jgi:hypothetical protein